MKNTVMKRIKSASAVILVVLTAATAVPTSLSVASASDNIAGGAVEYMAEIIPQANGDAFFADNGTLELTCVGGETVVVETYPVDGYELADIAIETEDGDTVEYAVSNGEITFTMPEDGVEIVPDFDPETDIVQTTDESVDVDLTKKEVKNSITDASLEKYIKENVDSNYAGNGEMELVNGIVVAQTMFDKNKVADGDTIDSIMTAIESGDEDEASEATEKYVAQTEALSALYRFGEDAEYYVAFVDSLGESNGDVCFANNNNNGETLDGCIFDAETGLAYIPKKYCTDENGDQVIAAVKMQVMQLVDGLDATSEIETVVDNGKKVTCATVTEASAFDTQTTIQTEAGLNEDKITVSVNGAPVDDGVFDYDSESGELTIDESPASIQSVSVTGKENTVLEKAVSLLAPVTEANAVEYDAMDFFADGVDISSLSVGDYWVDTVGYQYTNGTYAYDSYGAAVTQDQITALQNAIISGGSVNLSTIKSLEGVKYCTVNVWLNQGNMQNHVSGFDQITKCLTLKCSHYSTALNSSTAGAYGKGVYGVTTSVKAALRVLYIAPDKSYVVFGMVTQEVYTQAGVGMFKVKATTTTTTTPKYYPSISYSYAKYEAIDAYQPSVDLYIEKLDADTDEVVEGATFNIYRCSSDTTTYTYIYGLDDWGFTSGGTFYAYEKDLDTVLKHALQVNTVTQTGDEYECSVCGFTGTWNELEDHEKDTFHVLYPSNYELMGTVTTNSDGLATYHWLGDKKMVSGAQEGVTFCANYDELSDTDKAKVDASGVFKSRAAAYASAKAEVLEKVNKGANSTVYKGSKVTWKVVEMSVPSRYELAVDKYYEEKLSEAGETINGTSYATAVEITFKNPSYGKIDIKKLGKTTGEQIAGAEYTVYTDEACTEKAVDTDGNSVMTTLKSGYSDTLSYPAGTYYVKETKAAKGTVKDSTVYPVTVVAGETKHVNTTYVVDLEYGVATIKKVSSVDSSAAVSGAEYTVYTDSGCTKMAKTVSGKNAVMTTGSDGSSNLLYMEPGTYYVKETATPAGYTLNTTKYTLTIKRGEWQVIEAEDTPQVPVQFQKISADETLTDGNGCYSLKGAVYGVYKSKSDAISGKNAVTTLTTDEDGKTEVVYLDCDATGGTAKKTYYVKEITASQGYMLCDGSANDGADENGIHTITLDPKDYETTQVFTCKEQPANDPFSLQLQKMDYVKETAEAYGTASLEGAIFCVEYYDNTENDTSGTVFKKWYFRTDEDGFFSCRSEKYAISSYPMHDGTVLESDDFYKNKSGAIIYPLGTYRIYEVSPAQNYKLEGTMWLATNKKNTPSVTEGLTIVIKQDENGGSAERYDGTNLKTTGKITAENIAVNVYEKPEQGSITLYKYTEDGSKIPIEGAEFSIKGLNESYCDKDSVFTDSDGKIVFDELWPDEYTITEKSTGKEYTVSLSLLKDNVELSVPIEMTAAEVKASGADITKATFDEASQKYCFYDQTIEVGENITMEFPMTGFNDTMMPIVIIATCAAIAIGITIVMRKRRKTISALPGGVLSR